ncbi:MAG: adenine-specific methyltransferase EcoRI family protein [Selenomonadaceae bacterium]|nr:adenine-specific methyltransferase EcoRI family protein [Selenomonadaceae bacterium]
MAGNRNLHAAAQGKNDEFYTQYDDIQRELNCYYLYNKDFLRGKTVLLPCDDPQWSNFTKFFTMNFKRYGLKRLISTSYAAQKKKFIYKPMRDLFDDNDLPQFDGSKDFSHGRIYTLDADDIAKVDYPLKALTNWRYLQGDGDYRSAEVKALRDEADVIITNPPFSMFRDFLKWILDAGKQFLIIGNINCITYKEVFPLIMHNELWIGPSIHSGDRKFNVPDDYPLNAATCGIDEHGQKFINVKGVRWLTNLEHGKRHEPLQLLTYKQCEFCHPKVRGVGFQRYDNYDAIEVPATDAIPADYQGVMGVPITFLDKYCPEQFEIVGMAKRGAGDPALKTKVYTAADYPNYSDLNAGPVLKKDGQLRNTYPRVLIRHRR